MQTFRFIVIGDSGVGKSSLLLQFTEKSFNPCHDMTIGVEMGSRKIKLRNSNEPILVEIWDTAGQENYRSITRSYYRGSHACLVVFDISVRQSFDSLPVWLSEAKQNTNNPNLVMLLVGNKLDLEDKRKVTTEEAREFANANGMEYIELSAKNFEEVYTAFCRSAEQVQNFFNRTKAAKLQGMKLQGNAGGSKKGESNVQLVMKKSFQNGAGDCCI